MEKEALTLEALAIARTVEGKNGGLDKRVYAIVNYDNFSILPELLDDYSAMVQRLVDQFYSGVSRYTTSGFLSSARRCSVAVSRRIFSKIPKRHGRIGK